MMGMILKANVAVGDKVKAGDIVAVMESMKWS
jgi:biotin carboxyl carrier protein